MDPRRRLALAALSCALLAAVARGSAVLLVSLLSGSHLYGSLGVAGALAARGHDVWVLADDRTHALHMGPLGLPAGVRLVLFPASPARHSNETHLRLYIAERLANSALRRGLQDVHSASPGKSFDGQSEVCREILHSARTLERLRAVPFDVVVGDLACPCHVFLGQLLGVPYVHIAMMPLSPSLAGRFAGNPSAPAYVPELMSMQPDGMAFGERLLNTVQGWLSGRFYDSNVLTTMDETLRRHGIRPSASFGQLLSEARMWLCNTDFALDFARPLNPQVKFVGAVLTAPPKPLNEEWQSFADSAGEHGLVIMTMGTMISDELTDEQTENIAASLALLPQKVVWAYGGQPPRSLGNNTKLVKWIPQNDLLAHPSVRLFVSHCGVNSVHQGIYHGLPMVGLPVFADQPDNCVRVQAKGMGLCLNIRKLTERALYDACAEVINNEKYKANAERLSAIARDRAMPMSPLEEVAYWVEYAIKHGTEHLRPRSMQLSLVQYYLLDVLAVTALLLAASAWAAARLAARLCRRPCGARARSGEEGN